jgi:long-subunit fatty acid transport protein
MMKRSCTLSRIESVGLMTSLAAVMVLGVGTRARAAGVEDTVTGTEALGRSANFVRANDFMAVWQNPANLAALPGKELGLELRLPIFKGCFDREPDPAIAAGNGYLPTETFEESCNDAGPMPAGNLGFAMPLPRDFGFGVGVFTPGGVPKLKFGNDDVNAIALDQGSEPLPISMGKSESPARYLLIDRNTTAAYLMAGAGYAPTKQVRFGLSVGVGFVAIDYRNITSLYGGRFDDQNVVSNVKVLDAFVPRTTLSVAATPLDSVDLMASFTWNDDVSADGTLDVTAQGFDGAPRGDCSAAAPGPHCRVEDVKLEIPYQRFEVVIGGRYAQRRVKRERVIDPMKDEVWDVELDGLWSQTSHVDAYTLKIHDGTPAQNISFSSAPDGAVRPLPQEASLFHGWRNTMGLRLGGDYNVLPSRLALRLGAAYESSGVPAKNMNIDYWPVQKVTLSLGATLAVQRWRLSIAYAHVFYESITTAVGTGNVREVVALMQDRAQAVNEGKYSASLNVISLQANYRF